MNTTAWLGSWVIGSAMVCSVQAGTIGFWRMEESGKVSGDAIVSVANSQGAAGAATQNVTSGAVTPVYSNDVVGSTIYDPITQTNYSNGKSMLISGATGLSSYSTGLKVNNSASTLDTGTGSFTVELFFKETASGGGAITNTYYSQVVRRAGLANSSVFAVQMYDASHPFAPMGRIGAGGTNQDAVIYSTTTSLNDAQWHHLALIYDAAEHKEYIYLDYVNVGSRIVTVSFDNTGASVPLLFGRPSSNAIDGANDWYVDELRYSSGALSASQFLQIPEPASVSLMTVGGMLLMNRRK